MATLIENKVLNMIDEGCIGCLKVSWKMSQERIILPGEKIYPTVSNNLKECS